MLPTLERVTISKIAQELYSMPQLLPLLPLHVVFDVIKNVIVLQFPQNHKKTIDGMKFDFHQRSETILSYRHLCHSFAYGDYKIPLLRICNVTISRSAPSTEPHWTITENAFWKENLKYVGELRVVGSTYFEGINDSDIVELDLSNVHSLIFSNCYNLIGWSLRFLKNVHKLTLMNCEKIRDYHELEGCTIHTLRLLDFVSLRSQNRSLTYVKNVHTLSLSMADNLKDLIGGSVCTLKMTASSNLTNSSFDLFQPENNRIQTLVINQWYGMSDLRFVERLHLHNLEINSYDSDTTELLKSPTALHHEAVSKIHNCIFSTLNN